MLEELFSSYQNSGKSFLMKDYMFNQEQQKYFNSQNERLAQSEEYSSASQATCLDLPVSTRSRLLLNKFYLFN